MPCSIFRSREYCGRNLSKSGTWLTTAANLTTRLGWLPAPIQTMCGRRMANFHVVQQAKLGIPVTRPSHSSALCVMLTSYTSCPTMHTTQSRRYIASLFANAFFSTEISQHKHLPVHKRTLVRRRFLAPNLSEVRHIVPPFRWHWKNTLVGVNSFIRETSRTPILRRLYN